MSSNKDDTWFAPSMKTDVPWYYKEPESVNEATRQLLIGYSGVPEDEVVEHIVEVRDRAWAIHSYPCIGRFSFLNSSITVLPEYTEIVDRLKDGQKYLDLGCCFGQEIRHLAAAGVPSENMYGSDLQQSFMDLGYDMFLDREKLKTKFIAADIFDPSSPLNELDGKIDIVHAASFFHLFDGSKQLEVAKRVVKLLKPVPGSLVVGRQVGNVSPGEKERRSGRGSAMRHDERSWKEFWDTVGEETVTNWEVNATLFRQDLSFAIHMSPEEKDRGERRLIFAVRRL